MVVLLLLYSNLVFADYGTFLLIGSSCGMVSKSSRQITRKNEAKGISVSGMLQIHLVVLSQNLGYGFNTFMGSTLLPA